MYPQNYLEAVKWYRKAADQGQASAQNALGYCYSQGNGVPQDYAQAVKWYTKAGEQGDADAQGMLGVCFYLGNGTSQDYVEAVKWYRKAAEQGNANAQEHLGVCYYLAQGVAQDYAEAAKWFRKSAEQGNAAGQYSLGGSYDFGKGVPKDSVEAYKWYNLAAAQGDETAATNRLDLENRMTPEQIAEAQRLARDFKPSKTAQPAQSLSDAEPVAPTSPTSSGTGFFITDDGFLVTAAHVVNGANQIRLVTRTGLLIARLVKLDAANDLALLKAEGQFSALPIVSSRAVKLGSTIATIGFPNVGLQGFAPKFAKGEIASLTGPQDDPRYFQISAGPRPWPCAMRKEMTRRDISRRQEDRRGPHRRVQRSRGPGWAGRSTGEGRKVRAALCRLLEENDQLTTECDRLAVELESASESDEFHGSCRFAT